MGEEVLKKRVEQLEKQLKQLVVEINKNNRLSLVQSKMELYHYIARAIKNEADLDLLKEFLKEKKVYDSKEATAFRKNSELLRTYKDESSNILQLHDYYSKLKLNPNVANTNIGEFVSYSNILAQKTRIQIHRENAIKRGFSETSNEVLEFDKLIEELDSVLEELAKQKKPELKEEEYYLKQKDAEAIYTDLISNKDEVLDRIRKIPLVSQVHMEPHNKSLYYEVASNYWWGNFNASITMLSIWVESYLKELYFFKEKKTYEDTLAPLIIECKSKGILEDIEEKILSSFAETVRNDYVHFNLHKQIPRITIPAFRIDLKNSSIPPEQTYVTENNLPVIRSIAKRDMDKIKSRKLIIETTNLLTKVAKRVYANLHKKEERN